MPMQQTLRQKIFETKKRLSRPAINDQNLWYMGAASLLAFLTFTGILLTRSGDWGVVLFDIPVASQPFADEMLHNFREAPDPSIGSNTTVLALTSKELMFGDVAAFTAPKGDRRNKFTVPHLEGSPQVASALDQLTRWNDDRRRRLGIRSDNLLILLPETDVPVAIVTVVADRIRKSGSYEHIVIGGGFL